jgi:hypothetical protein
MKDNMDGFKEKKIMILRQKLLNYKKEHEHWKNKLDQ